VRPAVTVNARSWKLRGVKMQSRLCLYIFGKTGTAFQAVAWCSWSSRILNTWCSDKVLSSNLGAIKLLPLIGKIGGCSTIYDSQLEPLHVPPAADRVTEKEQVDPEGNVRLHAQAGNWKKSTRVRVGQTTSNADHPQYTRTSKARRKSKGSSTQHGKTDTTHAVQASGQRGDGFGICESGVKSQQAGRDIHNHPNWRTDWKAVCVDPCRNMKAVSSSAGQENAMADDAPFFRKTLLR
jgi:hypothetical protein